MGTPTVRNNLNYRGTVLVEHSDERLAAVEEAKRTGQEFRSVGTKGAEIVEREVLRAEVEKVSNEGSSNNGSMLPDYYLELKGGVEDEQALNREKARQHEEVSNEIQRARQEAEIAAIAIEREDPKFFVNQIIENNKKLAAEHEATSASFAADRIEVNSAAVEERQRIRIEDLYDPNPVTALGRMAKESVTDISETAAQEALVQKDRIIFGEDSFSSQAVAPMQEAQGAKSEDRAVERVADFEQPTTEDISAPKNARSKPKNAEPREEDEVAPMSDNEE